MLALTAVFLVSQVILAAAYPADPILAKFSDGLRYDYMESDDGDLQLVDNWMKLSDFERLARYDPDTSNIYHLFTRNNYPTSQPLVINNPATVLGSNYDGSKRTIILMHGFLGSVTSGFNTVLVPAFLEAADCNVIVLDWSAGSAWGPRAIQAAEAAARFINWLINLTGGSADRFHTVGYSVGGHGAGIIARNVIGNVGYVTGLDPADRWDDDYLFSINDGTYTEIIHTNVGNIGITLNLAHVDFYPNSGRDMPGCLTVLCDHYRSYYYFGESVTSGGFTGRRCANLHGALSGWCNEPETLTMGGFLPKTGATGIYYLRTNRAQPFSQG